MKKILIIGCPGSGKSTLAKELKAIINYPLLHLDKIYHINNRQHITREELKNEILKFDKENNCWIIDGNYISTMDFRIQLADTIIFYDLNTSICLENTINRAKKYEGRNRSDIADDFKEDLNEEFLKFIKNFKTDVKPEIDELLSKHNKEVIIINNYQEKEWFLSNFI